MSNNKEDEEKRSPIDRIDSLTEEIGDLKKRCTILESKKEELEIKLNELDFESLKNDLRKEVEAVAKKYSINYLEERNSKYLEEYKSIKDSFVLAKDGIIKDLREDKKNLERKIEFKEDKIEELEEKIKEKEKTDICNEKLNQDLIEANAQIDKLKFDIESQKGNVNSLGYEKESLMKELAISNRKVIELEKELNLKKDSISNLNYEKENLTELLETSKIKIIELESILKEKETKIDDLKNRNQQDRDNTLNQTEEIKNKLNNFVEKIENPYKDLLKAISQNTNVKNIEKFLGFENTKGLSKSMVIFSLINEDALARKIAQFYSERKEVMQEEDFKIIKEVNNIYLEEKPWGILYAESEGKYSSSLMRDVKNSEIYKTFTAMYSPAYRKDEDGNSPLKGIVDGKK